MPKNKNKTPALVHQVEEHSTTVLARSPHLASFSVVVVTEADDVPAEK